MEGTKNVNCLETGEKKYFYWRVTGVFSYQVNHYDYLESPVFHAFGATWNLRLYPNDTEGDIEIYLDKEGPGHKTHRVDYKLALKNEDGTIYHCMESTDDFTANTTSGWGTFLKRSTLLRDKKQLTSNDVLTFYLRLRSGIPYSADLSSQIVTQKDATCEEKERDCKNSGPFDMRDTDVFKENIAKMLSDESSSDFTLKVGENEFKAHKFILRARSEVFASMFDCDMVESRNSIANIEDCDPDAFRDFLQYLYTAKTDCLSPERMISLYCIADKYQVPELKEKCKKFLSSNITVDTFCDALSLALKYSEKELMLVSEEFFLTHANDILVSLQIFYKENMTAANELFIKYAKKFK